MSTGTGTGTGTARADIGIVGAGPTGLVLAILLAQRGRSVLVVERQPAPYPLPRAVAMDDEVGRIFEACGIGEGLRAASEPADTYEWRNASGVPLLRFHNPGDGPGGWPRTSMFNQPTLERLLSERVAALPNIELRRGGEVTSLEEHGQSVRIGIVDRDGSETAAEVSYLVGCDGANSTVRDLIGIEMTDLGFFFDWLVVDVILAEPRTYDPVNLQVCDPRRPTTLVSGGPGRRRWEFMRLPDEDPDEMSGEAAAWRLLEPWDVHPGNARLERHANYTFRARWATTWRRGRTLIAGDAAHQMPPFAGQGMCSGVRDAANLAWKLDLVVRGSSPALLDTYAAERQPHVQTVIELSIGLGKVICIPDPAEAAERDALMGAALAEQGVSELPDLPRTDVGVLDAGTPLAGALLPQAMLREHTESPDSGFVLLVSGLDAVPASALAAVRDLDVTVIEASTGAPRQWLDDNGLVAALQRPDLRLFGTAADPDGTVRLLDGLRSALA